MTLPPTPAGPSSNHAPVPGTDSTAENRSIDQRYAAQWRSALLVVLPFGVVAFLTGWVFENAGGVVSSWDASAYLVLGAGLTLLWGVLAVSQRALPAVLVAVIGSVSVFFAVKLVRLLFVTPAGVDVAAQMTESFFWIPAIYLLSFILPNLRAGRVIAFAFTVVMLVTSLVHVLQGVPAGLDLTAVYALVQLNLANVVFFTLTSTFADLRAEHTRTQVRMEATERFALTDPLTTLPNRHHLMQRLRTRTEREGAGAGAPFALLFMDLDGFKVVNDSLGHAGGDALLQLVAARLRGGLRDADFVARISGDEFVVIVDGAASRQAAGEVAQRLLDALVRPFELRSHTLRVSVSIGVSLYPDDGSDVDTLLRHADAAMYRVKRSGRNGVQHYLGEPDERLHRRRLLERDLHDAVQNGELALAYQSLHALASGEVRGFEALLRWHHPEFGEVSPCDFVPIAEQSGLIVGIGEWVLNEAARQAKAWEREGLGDLTVSVNVSPLQFSHPSFVDTLLAALRAHDLSPQRLELELTETVVLQDLAHVAATLARLQRLGIRIAIDDFGTGYSSLAYLRDLPIDTIKIDRAFVRDLGAAGATERPGAVLPADAPADAPAIAAAAAAFAPALVQAIVSLATSLGLEVVAEGIETDEQRTILQNLGCRSGQGYLYSRPMPATAVPDFLAREGVSVGGPGHRTSAEPHLPS